MKELTIEIRFKGMIETVGEHLKLYLSAQVSRVRGFSVVVDESQ